MTDHGCAVELQGVEGLVVVVIIITQFYGQHHGQDYCNVDEPSNVKAHTTEHAC